MSYSVICIMFVLCVIFGMGVRFVVCVICVV